MSVGITLQELLAWSRESSNFWKAHLAANPHLLELPCDIGGTANVQEFVRHIWGVELRWSQRLAGLPVTDREDLPPGPLDALFDLHSQAGGDLSRLAGRARRKLGAALHPRRGLVAAGGAKVSRRKVAVHALFHSQRHWAQLATLVRRQGSPQDSRVTCSSARRCR